MRQQSEERQYLCEGSKIFRFEIFNSLGIIIGVAEENGFDLLNKRFQMLLVSAAIVLETKRSGDEVDRE
jgi:sporulation protein YlmC with PRC-barrel domain